MNADDPQLTGASPRQPNEDDRRIGERIGALRRARRLTQATVAQALRVSHSQLAKYESGKNRVGAARLRELAAFFEVPLSSFHAASAEEREEAEIQGLLLEPGAAEALRAFAAIQDPAARADALSLLRTIARHCRARLSQCGDDPS